MSDIEANGTGRRGILPSNAGGRHSVVGNPTGLGMMAFATTLFVLSLYELNTRHVNEVNGVLGLSLFTGGLATFMAGMWHFPRGNGFGAAVFTMYGSFWMSYGLFIIPGTGIVGTIASIRRHITWILFFVFLTFTYLFFGVSNFSTRSGFPKAAGAFGIITSLIAYYHGLSKLMEGDHAPFALPLGRMGRSKQQQY
ncbi:GPR1/FUN34/yaaH family-domain-containing protein [Mycena albidolilacea]|uniref:GPR1/FUN34/yaaH family-domain-containing protein n=1 Tax=Mycena albidolilacea TaxID=1033008 RepID=A0AAD7EGT6_9AGAR|nr:GPR1/FUN34/yaaH family-domain-containing protein [Mycena albidolilacea]